MEYKLYLFLATICCAMILCDSNQRKTLDQNVTYHPFDQNLYKDVLDPELCQRQLNYLYNNNTILLARFLDSGGRIPKGIFMGNNLDMGNYHQCLAIKENVDELDFQGKYCIMRVSFNQEIEESQRGALLEYSTFDPENFYIIGNTLNNDTYRKQYASLRSMYGPDAEIESFIRSDDPLSSLQFSQAICIPAACTPKESIDALPVNISRLGITYEEGFCRLPNDKPWAPVDYVAIVIFSILGLLTVLSTAFEIYHSNILKKDSSKSNIHYLYTCFSVYTNTRRLLKFTSGPDSLECVDGIRALAMLWVILGHSFYAIPFNKNPIETFQWSISPNALWITTAHITVDTFFMLSGLLIVYTTAGKFTGGKLMRSLHVFYLNRLLRMFPLLAVVTLYEASLYNRASDGPFWSGPASNVLRCRQYWWSILLHIQNFVNPQNLCLGVTWYLSIDVQLHILSPLVLFWVLSSKKYAAWGALTVAMMSALTASTIYIFQNNFLSGIISPNRLDETSDYFVYFYVNTLTRMPPFFVGMIFGYLLHLWKGKDLNLNKVTAVLLWCATFVLYGTILYTMHVNMQLDWIDRQIADNIINSFTRSLWAVGLGWIIFACVKGYGGPINSFLSLQMWKLPARLSYAMYIIHYSVMIAYYYSALEPMYFSVPSVMFNFFGFLLIVVLLSFVVTVVVDAPFSTIFKHMLSTGSKKPKKVKEADSEVEPEHIMPFDTKIGRSNAAFDIEREEQMNAKS